MQTAAVAKGRSFIVLGWLETVSACFFFVFGHQANRAMAKDGIGDLATFKYYNGWAALFFCCFFVSMALAMIKFLKGKKFSIVRPITFPASLPILWVPLAFLVTFVAALII